MKSLLSQKWITLANPLHSNSPQWLTLRLFKSAKKKKDSLTEPALTGIKVRLSVLRSYNRSSGNSWRRDVWTSSMCSVTHVIYIKEWMQWAKSARHSDNQTRGRKCITWFDDPTSTLLKDTKSAVASTKVHVRWSNSPWNPPQNRNISFSSSSKTKWMPFSIDCLKMCAFIPVFNQLITSCPSPWRQDFHPRV